MSNASSGEICVAASLASKGPPILFLITMRPTLSSKRSRFRKLDWRARVHLRMDQTQLVEADLHCGKGDTKLTS